MKNSIKLLATFIACLFSITAVAQNQKTIETATIKTMIYCSHCKQCETCGEKFEKILIREKGVQMVTLDEKEMTIKVVYNTKKTTIDAIRKAIAKLGYDADDVKADTDAYAGLDDCCKK